MKQWYSIATIKPETNSKEVKLWYSITVVVLVCVVNKGNAQVSKKIIIRAEKERQVRWVKKLMRRGGHFKEHCFPKILLL
ncbi:hypothetical protein L6452_05359 [Arctium lappa]|uniref:Uncharacterized protein n=1 Tax=Arctium lappa TaxID=4217 RepID=A0ACB9EGD1_ARCLA|nr:hypothetical protein L6452_05359 [Arctium lappa]